MKYDVHNTYIDISWSSVNGAYKENIVIHGQNREDHQGVLLMNRYEKKITKAQYDRAKANRGYIANVDRPDIFNVSELCGYGVYSPMAFERDGEYYVSYLLGESCD